MSEKIALLFHGIVGGIDGQDGKGAPSDFVACSKLIKHFLIQNQDVDIFMHSWSAEHEKELKKIYSPKAAYFQKRDYFGITDRRLYPVMSRFMSLSKVLDLKQQYEKEHNFKYRWCMILRFDLVLFAGFKFNELDNSCIYFCHDTEIPEHKNPNQLHDIFMVANSDNINTFAGIKDRIHKNLSAYVRQPGETLLPKWIGNPHVMMWDHVKETFGLDKLRYVLRHYYDAIIYRHVISPHLNVVAKKYDLYSLKDRLNKTLKLIKEI